MKPELYNWQGGDIYSIMLYTIWYNSRYIFYRVKIGGTTATMNVGTSTIVGIGVEVTNVEAMTAEMEEKNVIIADVITDDDEKGFAVWRYLC